MRALRRITPPSQSHRSVSATSSPFSPQPLGDAMLRADGRSAEIRCSDARYPLRRCMHRARRSCSAHVERQRPLRLNAGVNLRQFDLNLLVALDALLTERSVTRAGERLFLSQPAMSGTLSRLRHVFHDELLVRAGRELQLTELAAGLANPVHECVLEIEALLNAKVPFAPRKRKPLLPDRRERLRRPFNAQGAVEVAHRGCAEYFAPILHAGGRASPISWPLET